jgi:VanZ family protein
MPESATVGSAAPGSPVVLTGLRLAAALLVLLLTAGLFMGGAQPVAVGLFKPGWDKLAHVAVFACMGFAYGVASGRQGWRMLLWSVLGTLAVGSMDELHQLRLPGREPSWEDLLADGAGGLLGGLGLQSGYAWLKWRGKRRGERMGQAASASKLQRAPRATA